MDCIRRLAGLIEIVWLDLILLRRQCRVAGTLYPRAAAGAAAPRREPRHFVNPSPCELRWPMRFSSRRELRPWGWPGRLALIFAAPAIVRRGEMEQDTSQPPRRTLAAALFACLAADAPARVAEHAGRAGGVWGRPSRWSCSDWPCSIPLLALGSGAIHSISCARRRCCGRAPELIGWCRGQNGRRPTR